MFLVCYVCAAPVVILGAIPGAADSQLGGALLLTFAGVGFAAGVAGNALNGGFAWVGFDWVKGWFGSAGLEADPKKPHNMWRNG